MVFKHLARLQICLVLAVVVMASACNNTPTASPGSINPASYLLTIDQMEAPGFLIQTAAHDIDANQAPAITGQSADLLRRTGYILGASVDYFRDTGSISVSNGPIEVISTVQRFSLAQQASDVLRADVSARESDKREQPISTGPLGDEAHADTELAVAPDADLTQVIQITVEWRVGNLLNILVVRGRYGGARLSDALQLAAAVVNNEQNGGAPRITASPTATSPGSRVTPSPSPTPKK